MSQLNVFCYRLKSELQQARRSYTEHDTKLQQQNTKFRERIDQISAELQTLRVS